MKASVAVITYNHAPFIRQALDSVLAQQTNFPFEIVIGEDESTDGTREIVREYQARHPEKIRLLLHRRKDVLYINGRPTGRRNFVETFQACSGQYIALLEGDDYWTSSEKLQRQVDCLERNPGFALCFHPVEVRQEPSGRLEPYFFQYKRAAYPLEELLAGRLPLQLCSVMVRRGLVTEFPEWYFRVVIGDQPFFILHAQHGEMGFIDQPMAVYRVHPGGYWSQGTLHSQWTTKTAIERIAATLAYNETLCAELPPEQGRHVLRRVAGLNCDLVRLYQKQRNWAKTREHLRRAWRARRGAVLHKKNLQAAFRSFVFHPCLDYLRGNGGPAR